MFTQIFPALMSHCRSESLKLPEPSDARRARAELDAAEALRGPLGGMTLSERLTDPAAYRALQGRRREALLLLLLSEPSQENLARIVDLIGMIIEESAWSEPSGGARFDDDSHPRIDLACAETAVLLAWCVKILGPRLDRLDTSISMRIRGEVRRRVLRPAMVHDDYPFMRGEGACPIAVCADILVCALLLESDEARLGRVVKPMLRRLDEVCGRHGRELRPLRESLSDISAATDLVSLLRMMTHQMVDLSGSVPAGDWLDELLYPWIQDEWFNDPAGDGMRPALSGGDLFRVGRAAGDEPLAQLGAHLYHQNHLPSQTVTGRLMEAAQADLLESTFGKPQRLRYAALRNNLLMAARVPDLYCSLHVGGGRGNAGDIALFASGTPILVDAGREISARSVPILADRDQLAAPPRPCIADFEARQDQEILSVDVTSAYPAACELRSYQRTVLTLRREQVVRIVDALDFAAPHSVTFRFVCAVKPVLLNGAVRLGPVRMTWEGDFNAVAVPLSPTLTLLELTAPQPIRQSFFTFTVTGGVGGAGGQSLPR